MDLRDLVPSNDNIQSRLFHMSPSSFIRGKFSDVKYMFEEANSCLQISISRERLNTFDDSSFIYAFQSFLIDFPSQIWLYIISKKKDPEMFNNTERKSLECVWQAVHKCP